MWVIFIILAAICNSIMDIVENENFNNSVFARHDYHFWYKRVSWKYAPKIFGYKIDAWHLFKSAMIILLCGSVISYHYMPWFRSNMLWNSGWAWIADVLIFATAWNLPFNFFYNKILRK
jgi:hypothetical protein